MFKTIQLKAPPHSSEGQGAGLAGGLRKLLGCPGSCLRIKATKTQRRPPVPVLEPTAGRSCSLLFSAFLGLLLDPIRTLGHCGPKLPSEVLDPDFLSPTVLHCTTLPNTPAQWPQS